MRRLRQSEVTSEMTNWALAVGPRLKWEVGQAEGPRQFGSMNVLAVVEIHTNGTISNPKPHPHPGVSLFESDCHPVEHPPVSLEFTEGIDVSSYQQGVDWAKVKESGRDFVYIRANHDPHLLYDDWFTRHWKGAGDVGMVRGAYVFLRAGHHTGTEHAEWLMNAAPSVELPYVIDVELDDHVPLSKVAACTLEAVEVFNQAGHRPVIYTMRGFWNTLPEMHGLDADLWVAHWKAKEPAHVVGWDEWLFWQYASDASVPGYPGHADVNRFRGSLETLRALV